MRILKIISICFLTLLFCNCGNKYSYKKIEHKLLYENRNGNQYSADIFLSDFTLENGENVLLEYVDKLKYENLGGVHVTCWNKEFRWNQMSDYYDDKFKPPAGTKNFLCNYGYKKDFKEIQKIVEFE